MIALKLNLVQISRYIKLFTRLCEGSAGEDGSGVPPQLFTTPGGGGGGREDGLHEEVAGGE